MKSGNTFFLLFAFFWTAITLLVDGIITVGIVRQADAGFRFLESSGTIVSSAIEDRGGAEGPNYEAVLKYSYLVNGMQYTSDRVTFGGTWTGNRAEAIQRMREFPLNATVRVFYDPVSPSTSVLRAGIQPDQIAIWVGFVTPFSAVMFFMWYAAWKSQWAIRNLPGGLGLAMTLVDDDGDRIRLGIVRHAAGLKAGAALAIIGMSSAALILLGFGSNLSMAMAFGAFAAAYGSAFAIYVILRRINSTGKYDMVIERSEQSIEIGDRVVKTGAGSYSFDEVDSVGIRSRMFGIESPSEVFDVVLMLPETVDPNPLPIGRTLSERDADVFREWLCSEFGWKPEVRECDRR